MSEHRIEEIALDERTILSRNAAIAREREIAVADLLDENYFEPLKMAGDGPWRLMLRVMEGRLVLEIAGADGEARSIVLSLTPLRKVIREYFAICDSYYQAIHGVTQRMAIETIDMARRGIHDRAAELLMARLDGKVQLDVDTARRLFTLICVLHAR